MSELLFNCPKTRNEINAYFDGARAAIRMYAVWSDGTQYVGIGRPINAAMNDLELMRQEQLEQCTSS
jgi:hypothetical protein